jgi:uncharacterized protein YpmB
MEFLIVLLIIVIILGAILGGKSFGGTVRIGCGFLVILLIIMVIIGVILYSNSDSKRVPDNKEAVSSSNTTAYFIVKQNCQTYEKPNIESDITGQLEEGEEILVENVNKFKYFYEVSNENGENRYVRKECLKIK